MKCNKFLCLMVVVTTQYIDARAIKSTVPPQVEKKPAEIIQVPVIEPVRPTRETQPIQVIQPVQEMQPIRVPVSFKNLLEEIRNPMANVLNADGTLTTFFVKKITESRLHPDFIEALLEAGVDLHIQLTGDLGQDILLRTRPAQQIRSIMSSVPMSPEQLQQAQKKMEQLQQQEQQLLQEQMKMQKQRRAEVEAQPQLSQSQLQLKNVNINALQNLLATTEKTAIASILTEGKHAFDMLLSLPEDHTYLFTMLGRHFYNKQPQLTKDTVIDQLYEQIRLNRVLQKYANDTLFQEIINGITAAYK